MGPEEIDMEVPKGGNITEIGTKSGHCLHITDIPYQTLRDHFITSARTYQERLEFDTLTIDIEDISYIRKIK